MLAAPSIKPPHRSLKHCIVRLLAVVVLLQLGWISSATISPVNAVDDPCTVITLTSCTIKKDVNSPGFPNITGKLSTSVSGMVPETAVALEGYAPPNAFIIVSEGTDVVGAGTAAADGTFSFMLHALQAGYPHAITLVAAGGSQVTPGTGFVVTPVVNSLTTVNNILLPTFIDVAPTSQNPGQPITVSGTTVPGGTVTLFIEDPGLTQDTQVIANGIGEWSVELISEFGVLAEGTYKAYAQVSYTGGLQSELSREVSFEVRPVATTTFLSINGYGPPGAFLSFKSNGTPVGTDIVPADGQFVKTLSFPDANANLFIEITADNGDQTTPVTAFYTSVIATQTTTVNDILLSTFIEVTPNIAEVGDPLIVAGSAAPNATIDLRVESPLQTTNVTVDANGLWTDNLIDLFGTFPVGTYKAYAYVNLTTINGPQTSVKSREFTFQVHTTETATDLVVKGFGAPGAFVTFVENNQVVGATTINTIGEFDHTIKFPDLSLNRTVSVIADNGTQQTPATTLTVNLLAFNVTTVANIMLPTFIDVLPRQAPYATTITVSGKTAPNSMVQVYVRNPIIDYPVISDANGNWTITTSDINSGNHLNKGKYLAYARAQKVPQGYMAGVSKEVEFEVVDSDNCATRRSDLNCDGLVDITDLGILIFYWGQAGSGQKADINHDSIVDISDVGILVYDWTY